MPFKPSRIAPFGLRREGDLDIGLSLKSGLELKYNIFVAFCASIGRAGRGLPYLAFFFF